MAQNNTTSTTFQNHRRKLWLKCTAYHLDLLSEQCERLPPDHPDRARLMSEI